MNRTLVLALFILYTINIFFQTKVLGEDSTYIEHSTNSGDFIFTSPHPLIIDETIRSIKKNTIGFDVLLSNSGFGFGIISEIYLSQKSKFISEIFFSPVKNTNELESTWDSYRYEGIVPGKINRLYTIPLILGMQYYLDNGISTKSIRPFVGFVVTPTLIGQMPYRDNGFVDVKYSQSHYRVGGGVVLGTDFGDITSSYLSFKMKYLYTPFGGNGLESVSGSPILNFGEFYLSVSFCNLF